MRVLFGRAERIGKPMRRAAWAQRRLLVFVRRPSSQGYDLETCRNTSIRRSKPVVIDFGRTKKQTAAAWRPAPAKQRVLFPHAAKIGHKAKHVRIGNGQPVGVSHRQRESGASEQAAGITHIGHRYGPGIDPTDKFLFSLKKRGAQLSQRVAAKKADQTESVRFQQSSDLRHHAGKIVHPMQEKAGEYSVERTFGERQPVIFAGDRRSGRGGKRRKCRRWVCLNHPPDLASAGKFMRQQPVMASQIKAKRKIAPHQFQPVDKATGGLALQEIKAGEACRGTASIAALRMAVEKLRNGVGLTHDQRTFGDAG